MASVDARFLLLVIALISFASPAAAGGLSLGAWQTEGSQTWRITFPPNGASELYYPHSTRYFTAAYENKPSRQGFLRLEGGISGGITAATGSDSDWNYAASPDLWYYGEFQTTGSGGFLSIDFIKQRAGGEYFLGYSYNQNTYRMTNGTYYVENYNRQNPPRSLPDLDSSYRIAYHGPHIGVRGQTRLTPAVSLTGSVAYSPFAVVEGQGWWNLRELEFTHNGSAQMLDASVGVRFVPAGQKDGSLTVGYRYQRLSLYSGTENTNANIVLDKAASIQRGFYFSSEFRF